MPKRTDIESILVIGSGPIIIGQACEFDYSGSQACKALRSEGYRVILVNSNPATIMTDPEVADRTYVEPLTAGVLAKIIERERPDALLPTVGGQTGLNLAVELAEKGVLDRFGVELIGAKLEAIRLAEDRLLFKRAMEEIGLEVPRSGLARNMAEAWGLAEEIGFPLIIRPSFTLGGTGGGIAYDREEFEEVAGRGLDQSPVHSVLVEESVIGWKEFELEVMRDLNDNFVVICSIENFDPMGVHTGDSITVAPAQTLTDREYQRMRDQAKKIIRKVGVETGGSNIQFAIHPQTGRIVAIEMNPRVSRSSALASKATGFPIAKIAAKLAIGLTLDEIPNDITRETPASFEPTIDYVVVKIPRWAFEKFPGADETLTSQMKSVGEVMAIGRTFKEALQKGLRSLEIGRAGLGCDGKEVVEPERIREKLITPNKDRVFYIAAALERGWSVEAIAELTAIDPWFVHQMKEILEERVRIAGCKLEDLSQEEFFRLKALGYSDRQLAYLTGTDELAVRSRRKALGVKPVFQRVDTCAAEFEAYTPYLYSTYGMECEAAPTCRPKVVILGSGPNRIGQGIEFDYCCCHAVAALSEEGYETIMINCNPETVSTDYDTSDRLYFEPLTFEDVMNILEVENPVGVIVQFGGQTPLNLAIPLQRAGVNILGTSPANIDLAEDRRRFDRLLERLGIPRPQSGTATSLEEAKAVASRIGFPVLVRPSYVLGGRAMAITHDEGSLERYVREAIVASPEHPVLIDRFLADAIEIDVDALSDGTRTVIGGIMQHIEQAGIHSGDSACVLPPYSLSQGSLDTIRDYTYRLAEALEVVGLMNAQYAIKDGVVYVLEVNPRASRTVPFVSKASGIPLAKVAAKLMVGRTLPELGFTQEVDYKDFFVKEVVLPFIKFPGVDAVLGPEMKSTGEVMGIAPSFGQAFAKSQMGAGLALPTKGTALVSVNDHDKKAIVPIARHLAELGFRILATQGTATALRSAGIPVILILKVSEGRPNVLNYVRNNEIQLIINTPRGGISFSDEASIRRAAISYNIPYTTTIAGATAAVSAILSLQSEELSVKSLQEYHAGRWGGGCRQGG